MNSQLTRLAILGSTGSIGTQALEVVAACPDRFDVVGLAAGSNSDLLLRQARQHGVSRVALGGQFEQAPVRVDGVEVLSGASGLKSIAAESGAELVLVATVGAAGFVPTVAAIDAGADIALASKELLVMAGELLMNHARERNVSVKPVDSEHSAIWQCLRGEDPRSVKKITLTASGGPFLRTPAEKFSSLTAADALRHPNWDMGSKVTIDSATLMNKGLEVIEAHWLFDVPLNQIEVLVHPQSIVHSLVEFVDGSVKAQLGEPDMRIPIACALGGPTRLPVGDLAPPLRLAKTADLTFEEPDHNRFPLLSLARQAAAAGGIAPAVLVGADDAAVAAFLAGQIRFDQIPQVLAQSLSEVPWEPLATIADAPHWHQRGFNLASDCLARL